MKIAFDARCINVPHLRGMGKYLLNIINNMLGFDDVSVALYSDRPEWPFFLPESWDERRASLKIFDLRGYRFKSWEQFGLPLALFRSDSSLLHAPATTLPLWQPIPTVVTIHDVIPWTGEEPLSFIEDFFFKRIYPMAYKKCSAIITISEASKRDILRLWPELEKRVFVIPHGLDAHYFENGGFRIPPPLEKMGLKKPYFLYIGGTPPRKRLNWAIKLISELPEDVALVVCGLGEAAKNFDVQVPTDIKKRIFFSPFIQELEMPGLYYNAVATLYPTLYEGFGFPVLESQAVGTPVLFSPVSSLKELIGPASIILAKNNFKDWIQACKKLLQDRAAYLKPNQKAREWAKKFNWKKSAEKHLQIYERVAMGSF